ncbi:MAG TPA: hypothetical protein VIJ68_03160 [Candidatus Saccharimonadales bacterium]
MKIFEKSPDIFTLRRYESFVRVSFCQAHTDIDNEFRPGSWRDQPAACGMSDNYVSLISISGLNQTLPFQAFTQTAAEAGPT